MATASVSALPFEEAGFISLLSKLLSESQQLQNNPPELVPVEDRGAATCCASPCALSPRC